MASNPAARSGWISQDDLKKKLGITDGMAASLRRKKIGPKCAKFDHHEPFSYDEADVREIRSALLGIGRLGLKLHGMVTPLTAENVPAYVWAEAPGPLISEREMLKELGISKRVAAGWRSQGIGPRCIRSSFTRPYDYQASDVAELRKHLIKLGKFGIGLPGLPPLRGGA
jgi:hypothetical protein